MPLTIILARTFFQRSTVLYKFGCRFEPLARRYDRAANYLMNRSIRDLTGDEVSPVCGPVESPCEEFEIPF
jgi:hypothetical protein